jgi:hypothetical protein
MTQLLEGLLGIGCLHPLLNWPEGVSTYVECAKCGEHIPIQVEEVSA